MNPLHQLLDELDRKLAAYEERRDNAGKHREEFLEYHHRAEEVRRVKLLVLDMLHGQGRMFDR